LRPHTHNSFATNKLNYYYYYSGAQINDGRGGNPLYWAEKKPVTNKKTIALLKKYGAINLPPHTEAEKKENKE
jgi:hypothetical protein